VTAGLFVALAQAMLERPTSRAVAEMASGRPGALTKLNGPSSPRLEPFSLARRGAGSGRRAPRRVPVPAAAAKKSGIRDGTKNNVHFVTQRRNDIPAFCISMRAGNWG
jgi:hypothetical protein